MECPTCHSQNLMKYGRQSCKQRYLCKDCNPSTSSGTSASSLSPTLQKATPEEIEQFIKSHNVTRKPALTRRLEQIAKGEHQKVGGVLLQIN